MKTNSSSTTTTATFLSSTCTWEASAEPISCHPPEPVQAQTTTTTTTQHNQQVRSPQQQQQHTPILPPSKSYYRFQSTQSQTHLHKRQPLQQQQEKQEQRQEQEQEQQHKQPRGTSRPRRTSRPRFLVSLQLLTALLGFLLGTFIPLSIHLRHVLSTSTWTTSSFDWSTDCLDLEPTQMGTTMQQQEQQEQQGVVVDSSSSSSSSDPNNYLHQQALIYSRQLLQQQQSNSPPPPSPPPPQDDNGRDDNDHVHLKNNNAKAKTSSDSSDHVVPESQSQQPPSQPAAQRLDESSLSSLSISQKFLRKHQDLLQRFRQEQIQHKTLVSGIIMDGADITLSSLTFLVQLNCVYQTEAVVMVGHHATDLMELYRILVAEMYPQRFQTCSSLLHTIQQPKAISKLRHRVTRLEEARVYFRQYVQDFVHDRRRRRQQEQKQQQHPEQEANSKVDDDDDDENENDDNTILVMVDFDLTELPPVAQVMGHVVDMVQPESDNVVDVLCAAGVFSFYENVEEGYYDTFATVLLPNTFVYPFQGRSNKTLLPGEDPKLVMSRSFTAVHLLQWLKQQGRELAATTKKEGIIAAKPTATPKDHSKKEEMTTMDEYGLPVMAPVPVNSCFGGLTLYRASVYFDTRCSHKRTHPEQYHEYSNKMDKSPCEHVVFHMCLKQLPRKHQSVATSQQAQSQSRPRAPSANKSNGHMNDGGMMTQEYHKVTRSLGDQQQQQQQQQPMSRGNSIITTDKTTTTTTTKPTNLTEAVMTTTKIAIQPDLRTRWVPDVLPNDNCCEDRKSPALTTLARDKLASLRK